MRYMVTGGLGVVGSLLARQLAGEGHEVDILDAAPEARQAWARQSLEADFPKQIRVLAADRIEEIPTVVLAGMLRRCDRVVHAAAHTGIPHSADVPHEDWRSNVDATKRLLDALHSLQSPPPTVLMSSVKPYRVHDLPVDETDTRFVWRADAFRQGVSTAGISESCMLEPDEPYAASKMAQSALGMAYARTYGLPVTVIRFSNLYGPAMCAGPRHGWLTWFCLSSVLGIPIQPQGTGKQVRDMLYSTDINAALLTALDNIEKTLGNVYNVGGGTANSTSINEAIETISKARAGTAVVRGAPGRRNEDLVFLTDTAKFREATGWQPTVSPLQGIERILEWGEVNKEAVAAVYASVLRGG